MRYLPLQKCAIIRLSKVTNVALCRLMWFAGHFDPTPSLSALRLPITNLVLFNRFEAKNPDVELDVNIVAWPGYAQLAAQMAAKDPPDLVTMHQGVISDYVSRGLLEPMDGILREAGVNPEGFTAASR